jgi:hypothetical protein
MTSALCNFLAQIRQPIHKHAIKNARVCDGYHTKQSRSRVEFTPVLSSRGNTMTTLTGTPATKKKSLSEATSGETVIAAICICFLGVIAVASLLLSNSEQLAAAINASAMW